MSDRNGLGMLVVVYVVGALAVAFGVAVIGSFLHLPGVVIAVLFLAAIVGLGFLAFKGRTADKKEQGRG
jgi:preprotein translocase subunit SecG